ncbi:hypothetical protein BGX26_001621 [Mortierella sp. AD094]|nr:hypothetical protein BGX26_001621 [Mortierella sp. AD094]
MGAFWTNTPSPSASSTPSPPGDNIDSVSVKPSPSPVKALSTPFPTQWLDDNSGVGQTAGKVPGASPTSSQSSVSDTTTNSPKVEPSPLPHLPFVPPPDQNPSLTGFPRFKPDPSSILLSYPRSNLDHTHDFYEIYNPSEKGLWSVASTVVMCGVAAVSKTFLTFGAYTGVYNMNSFLKILDDPHRTRPILTGYELGLRQSEKNGTCRAIDMPIELTAILYPSADDPLLWGALPWKCYKDPTKTIRYALGAQELCYPNKPVGAFFRFGQIVPIIRGNGIYQPAIDKSIDLLRTGKWVHIFPEGKINQTDQLIRLKWGVGRILMEYGGPTLAMGGKPMDQIEMPIVIPIYHLGMEDILRLYPDNSSPVFPKLGMPLTIVFGEPIDFTSLMQEYKEGRIHEVEARVKITERVFDAMDELRKVALRLQKEQEDRTEQDRIKKGHWWRIQPAGWGWWRSPDVKLEVTHRDTSIKIEEL